jgi:hypothetical protein
MLAVEEAEDACSENHGDLGMAQLRSEACGMATTRGNCGENKPFSGSITLRKI